MEVWYKLVEKDLEELPAVPDGVGAALREAAECGHVF